MCAGGKGGKVTENVSLESEEVELVIGGLPSSETNSSDGFDSPPRNGRPAWSRILWTAVTLMAVVLALGLPPAAVLLFKSASLNDPTDRHWNRDQRRHVELWISQRSDSILRNFIALRDDIANGTKERPADTPYCPQNADAFPGHLYTATGAKEDAVWEPDAPCRIKHFDTSAARQCLQKLDKHIVFFGDSLLNGVAMSLEYKLNVTAVQFDPPEIIPAKPKFGARHNMEIHLPGMEKPVLEYFWSQSTYLLDPTTRHNATLGLRRADLAVLHHSLWDLGKFCMGIAAYYHQLRNRINKMRGMMKPGSELVLFEMPHLQEGNCVHMFGVQRACMEFLPERRATYREALRLAAACSNLRLFSVRGLQKALPLHTPDGIHFEDAVVWNAESDLFLNGVCERDGQPPMDLEHPTDCDEKKFFKKWAKLPRAMYCPAEELVDP